MMNLRLFFFSFFMFFLCMYICKPEGYVRPEPLYIQRKTLPDLMPLICTFLRCLPASSYIPTFGDNPLLILAYTEFNQLESKSSPAWSILHSHSSSRFFVPSLIAPTLVDFIKSNSGHIAFLFASNSASFFFLLSLPLPANSFFV